MSYYWVYIIDHPQRDLSAIAWWVVNSNYHFGKKVCLLPTSEMTAEFLYSQKPDVIVWNYARSNNIEIIKLAKYLNIYNIIHDTEGIPYDLEYLKCLDLTDSQLTLIDEIWCWGTTQADQINSRLNCNGETIKVKVTGSIRYEYAKSLKKCNYKENNGKVLWNTNYPFIAPKYQSLWNEFRQSFQQYQYYSAEKALEACIESAANRQSSLEYITNLIEDKKEIELTLRPHPFESDSFYKDNILDKFPKTTISTVNDIHLDLENVSLVLQSGCQTALDAFIRGVPSIRSCKVNQNIWSEVTPYIDINILKEKILNKEFLEELLHEQSLLFARYKIESLLFNLNNPMNLKDLNLGQRRRSMRSILVLLHIIKMFIKSSLKKLIRRKISVEKYGKRKLSSSHINKFLSSNYPESIWIFKKQCILFPEPQ